MICPNCEKSKMSEAKESYNYDGWGQEEVVLKNITVRRCPSCGETLPVIPKEAELHRVLQLPGKARPIVAGYSDEMDCWWRQGGFYGCDLKFSHAPAVELEQYDDIAAEFMQRIFDLAPGDYAISDESFITDMASEGEADLKVRIAANYGFTPSSGRLVDIFREIRALRNAG